MKILVVAAAAFLLIPTPALATIVPVPEAGIASLLGAAAVVGVLVYRTRRGR